MSRSDDDSPRPFLVAFPPGIGPYGEDPGGEVTVMLDPEHFKGLDEVGGFLASLARHYARTFVQSGRARDEDDALDQVVEGFLAEFPLEADEVADFDAEDGVGGDDDVVDQIVEGLLVGFPLDAADDAGVEVAEIADASGLDDNADDADDNGPTGQRR
jgi:hypothetical protein